MQLRAFQFRLEPRPAQQRQLRRWAGGLRWLWNQALAEQRARYARGEPFASYVDMAKWLTAWRNAPATHWLSEGPVHPQQQCLKRLEEAYKRFFAKTGGFPKFKARGQEPGIRFPDAKQFELDQNNGRIRLPKLGWVRLRLSRPVAGQIRNVSLRQQAGHWYASIQVQIPDVAPACGLAPTLGIDLGLAAFAAGSDGQIIRPLKAMACQQRRLRRYQKAVSRKAKCSANRKKAITRLGRLHQRIARQRNDWLHKLSTKLAGEHAVIALEDLQVAAMSASAKGTPEAPGRHVKAKAGLNRGILDAAWGEFRRQLEYKTAAHGGRVWAVPAAYTSRTCRICGHESADNRKAQAEFSCVACGHTEHADVHAAKNILAAGHAAWERVSSMESAPKACGEAVSRAAPARARRAASAKQEPTEAFIQEATHA